MMPSRSLRRFAALAAVFALCLQSLWPLLAQARPQSLTLLAPLCNIDGVTHYLEIKAGRTTPLDERTAQHGEHCKLCVFGDGKTAFVSSLDDSAFLLLGRVEEIAVFTALPSDPLPYDLPAQPRAPPAVS